MASSSDRPSDPGANFPARALSARELEAVIRRAVELQAAGGAEDGIPEGEAMRIGKELGLEPALVRRAIGEVRGSPPGETGVIARVFGPGSVQAGRTIRRPAAELGRHLDEYMTRVECMRPHRRFRDRTRYVQDPSKKADRKHTADEAGTSGPRLDLKQIDVAVARVDDETSYVELTFDARGDRGDHATISIIFGTFLSVPAVAFALATAAPALLALGAVPIFGGLTAIGRAGHMSGLREMEDKLESFLDRLEHGEVRIPDEGVSSDAVRELEPPRL